MATPKTSSQIKGDKIKKAIADKGKTNFEKAFEKSPLSKSPTPGNTTSSNTGDGSGFKENLEYVAGVASRAAEKASSLRRQEMGNDASSIQSARSFQTNAIQRSRENQVADRNFAYSASTSENAANRSNNLMDSFNANQRQNVRINQQENQQRIANLQNEKRYREQSDKQEHQNVVAENQRAASIANQSIQSQQERALRAAQSAAQMQTQRNNQLLNLARGGL